MSIRRDPKTGIWHIDIERQGFPRVRKTAGTTDRAAAQEKHDGMVAELWRRKHLKELPRVTWDAAVEDWTDAAQRRGKRSLADDGDRLTWITRRLEGMLLADITADVIESTLRAKERDTRGTAPATINRYGAAISAVLHHAKRKGWLETVPAIERRQEPDDAGRWITQEQAGRLLAELPEHLAAMARFALLTGLRQANVCGLEWSKVDLLRRIAWVDASDAKGKRTIRVPLNDDAVAVIEGQRGQHERFVFVYQPVTPRGRSARAPHPISQPAGHAWEKAKARAGIDPEFRWHDLRHTWATWHVQGGTPLEVLQRLGGWRDIRMCQRYAKFAPDHLAQFSNNVSLQSVKPQSTVTHLFAHATSS